MVELSITDIKLNDNDYSSYDNVSVEVRSGTNDQSVISNFNDTYFTKNLSYLLDDSWAEDTAQGTGTQGLVFDIEFPNGLYYIDGYGNVYSAYVDLDIEYRISGGSWTDLFKEVASNSYGVTLNSNVAAGNYTLTLKGTTENVYYYDYDNGYNVITGTRFTGVDVIIGSARTHISAQVDNNYYDDDYYYEPTRYIPNTAVNVGNFRVNTGAWSSAIKATLESGGTVTGTITVTGGGTELKRITGSSRSAIRKQFRVDKITAGEYEVRVKVLARQYPTSNTQACSICYWTAVESVVYDDFQYPCTALIGIKAKATDQMNGSPSLTFMKERAKVWVYNGSSYVQKNANNPAWSCYDLLHQARQLKNINTNSDVMEVRGVPADRMRYADFAAWAAWCDTMKLFVNIEINTVGEMLEVANQKIAPIGRGMVVRFGTKYGCIYDHVQEPVQMFGMGNILSGTFSEEFLKVSDRANCVEVTFTNKAANYDRDVLTVYGDTFDSDGYAKTAQLTMDGIVDYQQAYREGKYQLMCNKYQLRTVSFEAGIDSIACTVGDVILVSHDVPKWANSGRIDTVNGTTLRLPVYISDTSQSYIIRYRTVKDVMYTYPITINSTSESGWTTVTLGSSYPQNDPPQAGDVFDIAVATVGSKPFVVKSITRAQDFTRRISCIEYAEALFDESYSIPPIQYATRAVGNAQNVSGLNASQYQYTDAYRVKHGVMDVSWKPPSNGGRFTVSISTDRAKWTTTVSGTNNNSVEFEVKANTAYYVRVITVLGISQSSGVIIGLIAPGIDNPPSAVTGLSYSIDASDRTVATLVWNPNNDLDFNHYEVTINNVTYRTASTKFSVTSAVNNPVVSVYAVDNAGNRSSAVSVTVPIVTYPSNVTGFTAVQMATDRTILEFKWNAITDSDLSQYEIRIGSSWQVGTPIAKTKTTRTTYQVTESGTYYFWIAAINNANNYSQTPAGIVKTINVVPDAVTNLDVVQSDKDHSKAVISFSRSPGQDIAHYTIKYGDTWDGGTTIVETKDNRFEWSVPASGTYNVMVKAVTVAGFESATANKSITITIEPLDVTNFHATQSTTNKTSVILTWDVVQQTDIAYYVIKQGTTWETGTIVAPRVSGTTYEVIISEEHLYSWMIKAVTIAGHESLYPATVSEIFGLEPTPVSQIQLRQNPKDRSQLNIQWTGVPDGDLVGYQVKIGDTWNSAEELPLTNELYAVYTLTETKSVHVMIRTLNSAGFYSDETSASLRCVVEPVNCTNFVAYQDGETVELYWKVSTDVDVTGYEIREGSFFSTGALVATGVTNNFFTVPVDMERLYQYHIVAINKAGFKSVSAQTARVLVENLPPKNVIQTFDEIARQSGTHNNTEFGQSLINFQTVGGRFSDYPTTRFSDLGGQNVLKLKLNASTNKYPASGTYTLQQIDIGSIITAQISAYFVSTVMYSGNVSAVLEFRTSLDNSNWIDWMEFKPIQRRFRYIEFRVRLGTEDDTKTPEVNHLTISIDVPDTDIAITYSIAASGTVVPYGHTFYTVPNVTANAIGETVHASVVSRTRTECTIKIFNTSNTAVSGTADIKIKGY